MEKVFGSTSPTEILWYSKLKYNQPGVYFCHLLILVASFLPLAASNFSALWVLAVLTIPYLVGAEVISWG